MKRRWIQSLLVLLLMLIVARATYPCGYDYSFRDYLDKRFWQPFAEYEKAMGLQPGRRGGGDESGGGAFAGMTAGGTPALERLREAYRAGDYAAAGQLVAPALAASDQQKEREEILVLSGKVAMREGERGDDKALGRAESAFTSYLGVARDPALASEARGWLARVYFLSGRFPAAAKLYLDEAQRADTIFSRSSLSTSLRLLYPYNGSRAWIGDHLEEYFDTPGHALFAVTIATNPVYIDEEERAAMAETAQKALRLLQQRRDLFVSGGASDALLLALMRAALFMGDTKAALAFAEKAEPASRVKTLPEFNWMAAASNYLQKRYAAAEKHLLAMYRSPQATIRDRSAAAQGLIGVYQALGRGVDQLHAAFLAKTQERGEYAEDGEPADFISWPAVGEVFDLPYLLDVRLTDEELRLYLQSNATAARKLRIVYWAQKRSGVDYPGIERSRPAYEVVQYALAVRYARAERYGEAALLYREIGARARAQRMEELARIFAQTQDPSLTGEQRRETRFRYAGFLAEHSTQVYFNDMFWHGRQTWTFLSSGGQAVPEGAGWRPGERKVGLTKSQRDTLLRLERQVRDDQEEYWRAYQVLVEVVRESGDTELGRQAVALSLKCLRRINTDRFGRGDEIAMAIRRLEDKPAIAGGIAGSERFLSPSGRYQVTFRELEHYHAPKGSRDADDVDTIRHEISFLDTKTARVQIAPYVDVYAYEFNSPAGPTSLKKIFSSFVWSPKEDYVLLPEEKWSGYPQSPNRKAINLNPSREWSEVRTAMDIVAWFDDTKAYGNYHNDCENSVVLFDGTTGKTSVVVPSTTFIGQRIVSVQGSRLLIMNLPTNCVGEDQRKAFTEKCLLVEMKSGATQSCNCPDVKQ